LRTGNRKCSAAHRRQFNSWYCQTIGDCRTQCPSARQVGDTDKCHTIHDFVDQQSDLVLYALWYPQPVETDQWISDMIRRPQLVDEPCSCSFHAHRCSRLTRQHGGEQSGLVTLTFGLLTLNLVSESRVTWATSVPILVFLGHSVLDLGPMYARDSQTEVRQIDVRQTSDSIIALCPAYYGRGIIALLIDYWLIIVMMQGHLTVL